MALDGEYNAGCNGSVKGDKSTATSIQQQSPRMGGGVQLPGSHHQQQRYDANQSCTDLEQGNQSSVQVGSNRQISQLQHQMMVDPILMHAWGGDLGLPGSP